MALIIKIQINHKILTIISAQRTDPEIKPVNRYHITAMDYRTDPEGDLTSYGCVDHVYADPAEILAKKAIDRVMNKDSKEVAKPKTPC